MAHPCFMASTAWARVVLTALVAWVGSAALPEAGALPAVTVADPGLEAAVDAYFAPLLQEDLISGSVLIARGDDILLAKGYGMANREHEIPNTPQTKFRLGSVTKQFTSAAIVLLAQRGELALEDSLARFLPDYPRGEDISLHQLMTHTAGVPNYNGIAGYDEAHIRPWSIDEVIAFFRDEPLLFEPGEGFAYSNSGYILLAKVIEVVSGDRYADFLRAELFQPLGMHDSGMDEFTTVLPRRATGHGKSGNGIYQTPYRDMPWTSGAGSLYSTILDLFRWHRALESDDLLTAQWRARMFAPTSHAYACGWFVREELGRKVIEHGGAINGFLSQIQRFVDDDLVVISLYNYETVFWRQANRALAAIALGELYTPALILEPVALEADVLQSYAGRYELMPGHEVTLSVAGERLLVTTPDENPAEALAQSETTFYIRDQAALLSIHLDEAGVVAGILIRQGANGFRGRRLE